MILLQNSIVKFVFNFKLTYELIAGIPSLCYA
jgi:hypothetical protein